MSRYLIKYVHSMTSIVVPLKPQNCFTIFSLFQRSLRGRLPDANPIQPRNTPPSSLASNNRPICTIDRVWRHHMISPGVDSRRGGDTEILPTYRGLYHRYPPFLPPSPYYFSNIRGKLSYWHCLETARSRPSHSTPERWVHSGSSREEPLDAVTYGSSWVSTGRIKILKSSQAILWSPLNINK